jgi:predicted DNA-binding protein
MHFEIELKELRLTKKYHNIILQYMTTKQITDSTSIRIPTKIKDSMQALAKSQNATLSGTITSALEHYLLEQKILKLQKQIQKLENWTAEEEIETIKNSRNNKQF